MLCQYRKGRGRAFDRGLAAKVLVPMRRGYRERLQAAWTGEHFIAPPLLTVSSSGGLQSGVEQRTQGRAVCRTPRRVCRLLTQPGPRVSEGEDGNGLETHADTHAIFVPGGHKSLLNWFRGRGAGSRYVVSLDEHGEVT